MASIKCSKCNSTKKVELTLKFSNAETIDQTWILFYLILLETIGGKWAPFTGRAAAVLRMKCQRRGRDSRGYDAESDSNSETSSSSMSDYGNDLEDVELELRRDRTRPRVSIRDSDNSEKNIYKK